MARKRLAEPRHGDDERDRGGRALPGSAGLAAEIDAARLREADARRVGRPARSVRLDRSAGRIASATGRRSKRRPVVPVVNGDKPVFRAFLLRFGLELGRLRKDVLPAGTVRIVDEGHGALGTRSPPGPAASRSVKQFASTAPRLSRLDRPAAQSARHFARPARGSASLSGARRGSESRGVAIGFSSPFRRCSARSARSGSRCGRRRRTRGRPDAR